MTSQEISVSKLTTRWERLFISKDYLLQSKFDFTLTRLFYKTPVIIGQSIAFDARLCYVAEELLPRSFLTGRHNVSDVQSCLTFDPFHLIHLLLTPKGSCLGFPIHLFDRSRRCARIPGSLVWENRDASHLQIILHLALVGLQIPYIGLGEAWQELLF